MTDLVETDNRHFWKEAIAGHVELSSSLHQMQLGLCECEKQLRERAEKMTGDSDQARDLRARILARAVQIHGMLGQLVAARAAFDERMRTLRSLFEAGVPDLSTLRNELQSAETG